MKKFKRLSAIFIALIMLVGLVPNVMAAEETTGSITIHKFDDTGENKGTTPHDGSKLDDPTGLGEPLSGISFRISQVADLKSASGNMTVKQAEELVEDTGYDMHQVTIITDSGGEAKASDLPLGVYLVEELLSPGITSTIESFLVHIPLTMHGTDEEDNLTQWLEYDLHVYPKNQKTYIKKSVNDETTSTNIGDTVTWDIEAGIPANIGDLDLDATPEKDYYRIVDVLDTRLDYKEISVYFMEEVEDAEGQKERKEVTAPEFAITSAHYTLIAPDVGKSGTVKVDFNTQAGIGLLTSAQAKGYFLVIQVKTTINRTAAYDLTKPITNTATLEYKIGNDKPDPIKPVDPPPAVTATGLSVVKYDKDLTRDEEKAPAEDPYYLAGAEFDLYWCATIDGTYNKVDTQTTDAMGLIYWKFDTTDIGYGYYYVEETKAPDGYELRIPPNFNLASDHPDYPIRQLYFVDENDNNLSGTWNLDNIKLDKEGGFKLPSTGGTGILLYTLMGIALITAGVIITIASKKKKRNGNGTK